ncbi:MAG: PKD domain-containing protein, partial [Bacteroidota bacterium]
MDTTHTLQPLKHFLHGKGLLLAVLVLMVSVIDSFGQQERFFNWYFGNKAGVSFASGSPVALTNSQMVTTEGCASISDATGLLMFYTDGISVWNRNHLVMTNGTGLTGHASSTQSGIIVQKPNSTNIYYIFTADADIGPNGIRYSEVNMNLSGGLGAVTANKNVLLQTPSCEKLTAVRHCNNRDLWIVSHDWNTNGFRAWLVTPTGVNTTPVTSATGSVITGINQSAYGQLKANPDGNKLLAGYYGFAGSGTNKFELYDFNNSTGVVSNGITLATEIGAYGCEFSPDGRIAYGGTNAGRLVQFNLCAGNTAAIQASKYVVGVLGPFIGSMQMGPDGKVYVSRNTTSLSVINNPNVYGAGCGFVNGAISLAGKSSSMGLPNIASFYVRPITPPFTYTANCLNVSFTPPVVNSTANSCSGAGSAIQGTRWNFGDAASGANNTSTLATPSHTYSAVGNYQVSLILNMGCYNDTLIQTVSVSGFTVNTSVTPASCGSSNGTATATPAVAGTYTYAWSNGQTTQTATGLAAGSYTCVVSASSGCTSTVTVSIVSSGSLSATTSVNSVACFGGSTGSATASGTGGTSPYTYSWNNGASGATASNLVAGTYSVTVSDASGCSTTQTATITQPTALAATATAAAPSCLGGTGSATVTASGGTSPYTYLWSNGATTTTASGLGNGNYTVTVTDNRGCNITKSVTVNQPTLLVANISPTAILCNGVASGALTASVSGGTAPYTYSWSNASTTANISNLGPGTYTVTVTDASGCIKTASSTLTQPTLLVASISSTAIMCNGAANGILTASASGGTAPYSYSWSTGATTASISNLGPATYTVTVTDASGCTKTASSTLTQPAALNVSMGSTIASCGASNGTATATPAIAGTYSYLWSNGQTTQTATALTAGNYTVTVTSASGCSANASVIVSSTGSVGVTVNTSNASCFGTATGSATASGTGGTSPYTYSWSNAATGSTATNLIAGNYTVTATDASGCTSTQTFVITQPTALTATATAAASSCVGGTGSASVSVSGGTAPYSYLWTNGSTSTVASNLSNGSHSVTITDSRGCIITRSVTITQPTALSGSISKTNVTCNGLSNGSAIASISGGTSPYSYAWSNGASLATASNLAAGNYTLTVTDANGCSLSLSTSITQPTLLTASATATPATCLPTGSASATAAGGTSPYTYVWSNSATSSTVNGLSSGTFTVTVSDANLCSASASVTVSQPAALSVTINQTAITCNGASNGALTASPSGGTSPYTYAWSNGGNTVNIQNLSPGTYTVTVSDASGCSVNGSATLTQPTGMTLSSSITPATCGGNDGTASVTVSSGTGPFSYAWTTSPVQTTATATGLSSGSYSVTVTDASGCSANTSISIANTGGLTLLVTPTSQISCFGGNDGSAVAVANGGASPYTYVWSNSATGSNLSNVVAGTYTCTVTAANGCTAGQSITLTEPTALTALVSTTPISCYNANDGTATINASGGAGLYTYSWSNGALGATATNLATGTITVVITDQNNCSISRTISMSAPVQLVVQSTPSMVICSGVSTGSISLAISGGNSPYTTSWSNSATGNSINGLGAGTYTYTVTDASGCTTSASIVITEPVQLQASVVSSPASCYGLADGAVNLSISGGIQPYQINWSNGNTTEDISGQA